MNTLITGGTSAIAQALAEKLAREGRRLILASRNVDELERFAQGLRSRTRADVRVVHFDAEAFDAHRQLVETAREHFSDALDAVILCHGIVLRQDGGEADPAQVRQMITANYASLVSLLEPVATYFQQRGRGTIAAITSLAGERGRRRNYLYGSTKAAADCYLQGLRHRLGPHGVHVLTIKPGSVRTKQDPKSRSGRLVVTPERVARDIRRALRRRKNVLYTPWYWRWIMLTIRAVPDQIFNRINF